MSISNWTDADSTRALDIWSEYQRHHDVTARKGQAVGIDPITGRVWFGRTAKDIWRQMDQEGVDAPIYCLRVGSNYYGRKGGRR